MMLANYGAKDYVSREEETIEIKNAAEKRE